MREILGKTSKLGLINGLDIFEDKPSPSLRARRSCG
jgi:hypothetical protein